MTVLHILKNTYQTLSAKNRKQVFLLVILLLILVFFELSLAGVISLLGVALAAPESLDKIYFIRLILEYINIPQGIPPVIGMLVITLTLVVIATICKNIVTAYVTYKQAFVSQSIAWDSGIYIFHKYLHAPYIWYTQQNTAELQAHINWRAYISSYWLATLNIVTQSAIMLFLMLAAFIVSPLESLILYGVCGITAFFVYKFTRKKVQLLGEKSAKLGVRASTVSHFALQGMREVHIYNQRDTFFEQFKRVAQPSIEVGSLQIIYPPMPLWVLESVGFVILLGTVILMQWQGKSIATITGTLTLMAGISWRLLPAMNKFVSNTLVLKANYSPAKILIEKYFHLPADVQYTQKFNFNKALSLQNVNFSYPNTDKKALNNITLDIPKGSMVGLVGLSGAGKSTLVGLITGLLPKTSGEVFIDSQAINPSPGYLNIGYVPQSPYIMDATLAQNVAFSDWGKDLDDERVKACCELAAMDFLNELELGIHTVLGDRGVRLSGGQIQRVAIARALYTNPDILLFDEATSALDGATEAAIQNTILNLRKSITVVIIAHRLSTIEGCDKVYWLHDGEIKDCSDNTDTLEQYKIFLEEQAHSQK